MDNVKAVYEHRSTWIVLLVLGLAVWIVGVFVHGDGGGTTRSAGVLLVFLSMVRVSHQAANDRMHDAYRAGRRDKKQYGPVLVPYPRREESADR